MSKTDRKEQRQLQDEARQHVEEMTPEGWTRQLVIPPWRGQGTSDGLCRSCGATATTHPNVRWTIGVLARWLEDKRILLFTFAVVCSGCVQDRAKMGELARRAFDTKH